MKKRVLITFQNLQENSCVGVYCLIKLQSSGDYDTGAFLWILWNFWKHFFTEHLRWLLFTIKKVCEVSFSFSIFLFALVLRWLQRKKWKIGRFLLLLCLLILFSEERNNFLNEMGMQFDRERADNERKLNYVNAMVSQFLLFFLKSYIHKLQRKQKFADG